MFKRCKSANSLFRTFKKNFRNSETADCLLKWKTRHNAEPSQCITKFTYVRQYSQWFSSLSLVSWLRGLTISQNINLIIISEKRVKKSVEKRQHKIKQINYWQFFKETIKVESRKNRVETYIQKLFCNR